MPHSRRLLWSMANEGGKFVYKSVSGVFEVNPNIAGKGGGAVIRDHWGKWVVGFSCHIGIASNNKAELWAIR